MPEAWKAEFGPDWAQVWHNWRHTLGNLSCTAFNSEMGNCSFPRKRDAERGFRNSPLRLNADLRETERWDEPAIRARGARLADLAVDIWRRPVLTDRVLASYETPRTDAGGYTIEHHPHLRPGEPMHDLFEAVRQAILRPRPAGPGRVPEALCRLQDAHQLRRRGAAEAPPPAEPQHAVRRARRSARACRRHHQPGALGEMAMSRWSWITNARSPVRWSLSARPSRANSQGAIRRRLDDAVGSGSQFGRIFERHLTFRYRQRGLRQATPAGAPAWPRRVPGHVSFSNVGEKQPLAGQSPVLRERLTRSGRAFPCFRFRRLPTPGMGDPAMPVRRPPHSQHRPAPAPPPGVRPMSRPRLLPPKRRPRATSACHEIHTCPVSVHFAVRSGSRDSLISRSSSVGGQGQ